MILVAIFIMVMVMMFVIMVMSAARSIGIMLVVVMWMRCSGKPWYTGSSSGHSGRHGKTFFNIFDGAHFFNLSKDH